MLHEISFKSFNERDEVQGWVYVPACEPKGIIQLIHGFGEHSRRYFHMIVAFMDAGFIVAADDHVGHGKTAVVNDTWGDWGDKGAHTMMEDEHILTGIVKEMYPGLPYFLFGHSTYASCVKETTDKNLVSFRLVFNASRYKSEGYTVILDLLGLNTESFHELSVNSR